MGSASPLSWLSEHPGQGCCPWEGSQQASVLPTPAQASDTSSEH